MNVRQFAKHIGVSHPAVLKAMKQGRLTHSLRRDARGRVDIDPEEGAREWESKGRLSPQERRGERDLFPAAKRCRDEVTRRLVEIVDADLAEVRGYIVGLVPHVIEGAIQAFRRAGREPTAAELVTAMCLEPDNEDAGIDLLVALHEIVDGDGAACGTAIEIARQAGRDAVAWQCRTPAALAERADGIESEG